MIFEASLLAEADPHMGATRKPHEFLAYRTLIEKVL
jgi:hypothetical protein